MLPVACTLSEAPRAVTFRLVSARNLSAYGCLYVTVSAPDLPHAFEGTSVAPKACLPSGVVSPPVVPAASGPTEISLTVPPGRGRAVHVLGVVRSGGCAGISDVRDLFVGTVPEVREIATGVTDTLASGMLHVAASAQVSEDLVACTSGGGTLEPPPGTSGGLVTGWGSQGALRFDASGVTRESALNGVIDVGNGVVVGVGYARDASGVKRAMAVQLKSDGTFDTTFGTSGIFTSSFGGNGDAELFAATRQSDGKIVVAGYATYLGDQSTVVARLTTGGGLDSSFGTSGYTPDNFSASFNETAKAVTLDGSGRVLVAGSAMQGASTTTAIIARYTALGALDTSYRSPYGFTYSSLGQYAEFRGIAVDRNGNYAVGAMVYSPGPAAQFFMGYFGTVGSNSPVAGNSLTIAGGGGGDVLTGWALQFPGASNERALAVGYGGSGLTSVARTDTSGSFDATFGPNNDGKLTFDIEAGQPDNPTALAVRADGKFYVTGYLNASGTTFVLRRNADGTADTTFGTAGIAKFSHFGPYGADQLLGIALSGTTQLTLVGFTPGPAPLESLAVRVFQ